MRPTKSNETPAWVGYTYLIYIIAVMVICIGLPMYAVFFHNANGWQVLGGLVIACFGWRPYKWHSLCTGIIPEDERNDV